MKDFLLEVLDFLDTLGVEYGEVRSGHRWWEEISVKNGKPEGIRNEESIGWSVRVWRKGCWGFAAAAGWDRERIPRVVTQAQEIAQASSLVRRRHPSFSPPSATKASYCTQFCQNPFTISLADKLTLLSEATRLMLKEKSVRFARGFLDSFREHKFFASTHGSLIEQQIMWCGGGIQATAIRNGQVQQRSYPSSFRGNFATRGWEFVSRLALVDNAPRVAAEAAALLKAPPCPELTTTIILEDDQLALQIHESIGHAIELDRILGSEASFAGTSFVSPRMLRDFRYGSPLVNVTADATAPGGLGTFGFDDEGVPAQATPIIREGILVGLLSDCSSAAAIGQSSSGTARSEGWSHIPLVRMTNINMEPGEDDYRQMIAETKHGFLLKNNKSWSIDDKRLNFQFAAELAMEIKNGKLGRIFKNPVYTGRTPEFWRNCDAVANRRSWRLWGTPNCGKGEPAQTMFVGHGASPARFRNVRLFGTP